MLKENELRIGNWVINGRKNPEGRNWWPENVPVMVGGIHTSGNVYVLDETCDDQKRLIEPLPILLTPETLEKAGFKRDRNGWQKNNTQLSFSLTKHGTYLPCWDDRAMKEPLSYLHQLQNLYFAIIGKELEIDLN